MLQYSAVGKHSTALSIQHDRERYARSTAKERQKSSLRFRHLTSFRSHALELRCSTSCLNAYSSSKRGPVTPASTARDRNAEISAMNGCMSSCKTQVCCSCSIMSCCICVFLSRSAVSVTRCYQSVTKQSHYLHYARKFLLFPGLALMSSRLY